MPAAVVFARQPALNAISRLLHSAVCRVELYGFVGKKYFLSGIETLVPAQVAPVAHSWLSAGALHVLGAEAHTSVPPLYTKGH